MKPVKTQFSAFVQWSNNIEDRIINFHIDDAFYYVIRGKLGYPKDSTKDLGLEISKYEATSDDQTELFTFFNGYILRWWVLIAFKRFLENHGRNVTQFGYTSLKDPEGTFDQVDEIGRAVYLRRLQTDINIAETDIFLELHKVNWTFDGYQYLHDSFCRTRKKDFGIRAIGHQVSFDRERRYGNYLRPGDFSTPTTDPMGWISQGYWDASSNQLTLAMQTAKKDYTWETSSASTILVGPDGGLILKYATVRALVQNPGANIADQTKWKITY